MAHLQKLQMNLRSLPISLLMALLLLAEGVEGQHVQGRIQDDLGQWVATALVTLEEEGGITVRAVVSTSEGDYSIPAGRSGRFRIRVERLGLTPFTTPTFELHVGETRTLPITVPPAPVVLGGIDVEGESRCEVRPEDARLIARLRDEAGRVFRDAPPLDPGAVLSGFRAIHYRRELDPSGETQLAVERRDEYALGSFLPFAPRAENQLLWGGFTALAEEDRQFSFYAPPVEMIFSEPFLDRTCFTRIVEREGRVGIVFAPLEGMTVMGIGGTIWLDPETLQARLLSYEYYDPVGEKPNGGSGEVELVTLPDGTFLLARWWIRLPSELELPPENVMNGRARALALAEEGGLLVDREGVPIGGGSAILAAIGPDPRLAEEGDQPLLTLLPRSLVMRTIPNEAYIRAEPVILASMTSLTALEMDRFYSTVPTVLELLRLRYSSVLEDGQRLRSTSERCGPPHFVVDGVPTPAQSAWDLPGYIVSRVEVHRHGAMLAMYGFQGSCGVVELWTRR